MLKNNNVLDEAFCVVQSNLVYNFNPVGDADPNSYPNTYTWQNCPVEIKANLPAPSDQAKRALMDSFLRVLLQDVGDPATIKCTPPPACNTRITGTFTLDYLRGNDRFQMATKNFECPNVCPHAEEFRIRSTSDYLVDLLNPRQTVAQCEARLQGLIEGLCGQGDMRPCNGRVNNLDDHPCDMRDDVQNTGFSAEVEAKCPPRPAEKNAGDKRKITVDDNAKPKKQKDKHDEHKDNPKPKNKFGRKAK